MGMVYELDDIEKRAVPHTRENRQMTHHTEQRRIKDTCAFVHQRIGIRCGSDRASHDLRYTDHVFKEFADASPLPAQIAKHPFEPLPNDSVTCRVCGQMPSNNAHSNVPSATPDTEEEWRVVPMDIHGWAIFDKDDAEIVSNVYSEEIVAQIVADHKAAKSQALLVEALRGVAIMLNTELKPFEGEPWAQRVRAALKPAGLLG